MYFFLGVASDTILLPRNAKLKQLLSYSVILAHDASDSLNNSNELEEQVRVYPHKPIQSTASSATTSCCIGGPNDQVEPAKFID